MSPRPSRKPRTHQTGRQRCSSDTANLETRLTRLRKEGTIDTRAVRAFQRLIYRHYEKSGRSLPWRETRDPYRILVSEVMLQQTQVERVLTKYEQFIAVFPGIDALAKAPLRRVLEQWQGLGYNRRALALKKSAHIVMKEYGGKVPSEPDILITLPGIGTATAAAVAAFAFNRPSVLVETNIRRVFIHFFFRGNEKVRDADIIPVVEQTLDASNPREWYYALMDYGVMLGRNGQNPNRRSAHYAKQSPFEGSTRQLRGLILRTLMSDRPLTGRQLAHKLGTDPKKTQELLQQLKREGFLRKNGTAYTLP